jgi:hypothetical protein
MIVSIFYSLENHKRVRWERCAWFLTLVRILAGCAASSRAPELNPVDADDSTAGWNRSWLDEAFVLAQRYGTDSLLVMTHGKTIQPMGDIRKRHRVHSVRKSLLSALVGRYAGSGPGQIWGPHWKHSALRTGPNR